MSRRRFFRTGFVGLFAAALPWSVASARRQDNADDISDLKDRVATLEENLNKQQTSSPPNVPIGTILAYAGPIDADHPLPEGWLLCDGSAVSSATYGGLWLKLRVAEGAGFRGAWGGNGNPDFNLPDLAGRFLRGVDRDKAGRQISPPRDSGREDRYASKANGNVKNNVGSVQGSATAMPANRFAVTSEESGHSHTYKHHNGVVPIYNGVPLNFSNSNHPVAKDEFTSDTTTGGGAHTHKFTGGDDETRPLNAYVYWIIRAK